MPFSVNNPEKGAVTHAIFHRVILEYLTEIRLLPEEEEEKLRREIFDRFRFILARSQVLAHLCF